MAGGKGDMSLERGGRPDPGPGCAGDRLPGRTGPGGEAQSLHGARVAWASPCARAGMGSALGEEALSALQGPAAPARGP